MSSEVEVYGMASQLRRQVMTQRPEPCPKQDKHPHEYERAFMCHDAAILCQGCRATAYVYIIPFNELCRDCLMSEPISPPLCKPDSKVAPGRMGHTVSLYRFARPQERMDPKVRISSHARDMHA
jgi:hypothetical protein